jgi:CDP-diacylglycerol--glycerol-3-phosphate 3-phosphatidyltransferase
MAGKAETAESGGMRSLQREWGVYVVVSATFLLAVFLLLREFWQPAYAWRWLLVTAVMVIYPVVYLRAHLGENRLKSGEGALFPTLGPANWITLIRAVLSAGLAGFVVCPRPEGWLAWAPSLLYLTAVLMDFADGATARLTGRTTVLGDRMDMQWDSTGVLIGSLLSVIYRQTPMAYLLVGLARYIFLLGLRLHERRGLPVYDLPVSQIRRPFAGAQMVFLAIALMPLYTPPVTRAAAWLLMTPFLINFLHDWLVVSGGLGQPRPAAWRRIAVPQSVKRILPLVVRAGLVVLLGDLLLHVAGQKPLDLGVLILSALAIPSLLFGIAGRSFSLAVLLMTGIGLQAYPVEWRFWILLVFSAISMMVGTGSYSLWKPEDWLLFERAGEKRRAARAGR